MARILLADADAFFVGVARLADPEGAGRAPLLIVGGSRDSRGVVCSASYETRKFGVRSAMPIARALRLCPDAMCVPVPRKACSEKSAEIRSVLEKFAPIVEGASIDEWYMDLAGTEGIYGNEPLAHTAHRMRDAAWLWNRAHGVDESPVESRGDARSISRDETFSEDLREDRDLERELLALVTRAAHDLRADGMTARTITVRIRDMDFRTRGAQ